MRTDIQHISGKSTKFNVFLRWKHDVIITRCHKMSIEIHIGRITAADRIWPNFIPLYLGCNFNKRRRTKSWSSIRKHTKLNEHNTFNRRRKVFHVRQFHLREAMHQKVYSNENIHLVCYVYRETTTLKTAWISSLSGFFDLRNFLTTQHWKYLWARRFQELFHNVSTLRAPDRYLLISTLQNTENIPLQDDFKI